MEDWAVKPESINFRRWENGNVIANTALGKAFQENFEVQYYVAHRAHFHEAFFQPGLNTGVGVRLDSKAIQYNELQGTAVLSNGSTTQEDLVIAADC